jgi:hypothetical protein
LCERIELGYSYKKACELCGLSYSTFFEWLRYADEPDCEERYTVFSHLIRESEAKCLDQKLKTIKAAIDDGNVAVAQWFVERRMREDFGKSEDINLKNQHSGEVKIELNVSDCGDTGSDDVQND